MIRTATNAGLIKKAIANPDKSFAVLCLHDTGPIKDRWERVFGEIPENIEFVKMKTGHHSDIIFCDDLVKEAQNGR